MRARGSFFNGGTIAGNIVTPLLKNGSGSPEGAVTAGVGAIYQDTTNGKLYEKVSGTGNTGWREVSPSVSGTYTPTGTIVANLDSVTPGLCMYMRVGSMVIVYGSIAVDPTAASSWTARITLPVASNLASASDLWGQGRTIVASGNTVTSVIEADTANDAASICANGNALTTAYTQAFNFMYQVL